MGFWSNWLGVDTAVDLAASAPSGRPLLVESPWTPSPSTLNSVVWPDLLGVEYLPLSRAEAMSVPAVARARQLLTATIARLPLLAYQGGKIADSQPLWTTRTDGALSPFHRMLWTVDDLIFYGFSLWRVGRDSSGRVTQSARVNFDRWEFDTVGRITVDGELVDDREYVLIPGVHEGLITFGARTIRQASNLLASADKAAATPAAYLELHQTNEAPMNDTEISGLIASWAAARKGANGGVAFTTSGVEVKEHGSYESQLLIDGRNASAVDIARAMGIPAALIDAQAQTGALTYETTQSRNAEFIDYGLSPYMSAISGRLSLDDVCPRGTEVSFDLEKFLANSPVPLSVKTADEVVDDTQTPSRPVASPPLGGVGTTDDGK